MSHNMDNIDAQQMRKLAEEYSEYYVNSSGFIDILLHAGKSEDTFLSFYRLFNAAVSKLKPETYASFIKGFFAKNELTQKNMHLLSDWADKLSSKHIAEIKGNQFNNPLIHEVLPEKFNEEHWAIYAQELLNNGHYSTSINIIKKHIAPRDEHPTKIKTMFIMGEIFGMAAETRPEIFKNLIEDLPWSGVFILASPKAKLVARFISSADEKVVTDSFSDSRLTTLYGSLTKTMLYQLRTKNQTKDQKTLAVINYAMEFAEAFNSSDRMAFAQQHLERAFECNPELLSNFKLKRHADEDFIQLFHRANTLSVGGSQMLSAGGDEGLVKWNKFKQAQHLQQIAEHNATKPKLKI